MKAPIFISGLRKSGTSLVKHLLDSHSELFVFPPNELHFFGYSYHPSLVKDKQASISSPRELIRRIADNYFIKRLIRETDYYLPQFDYEKFIDCIEQHPPESYEQVYENLFRAFYHALGNTSSLEHLRFVSKTVLETEFFPELLNWFPDLKFIYVLRNPYAHYVSAVKSLRTHTSRQKGQKYEGMKLSAIGNPYPYIGHEIYRMKHSYYFMEKFSHLYPDRFYVLIYDELLKNSKKEMEKLCDFLGIQFDPVLLRPTLLNQFWQGNSWHYSDFTGIDKRPMNKWKEEISKVEIRFLNKFFGSFIKRYFHMEESKAPVWKPLHVSEYKITNYLANRVLYHSHIT
ncbi:MAG: sulfotransferase [Bacteroidales bacterium]|nr:sulfotransferase [Bacteroidales bacterium]